MWAERRQGCPLYIEKKNSRVCVCVCIYVYVYMYIYYVDCFFVDMLISIVIFRRSLLFLYISFWLAQLLSHFPCFYTYIYIPIYTILLGSLMKVFPSLLLFLNVEFIFLIIAMLWHVFNYKYTISNKIFPVFFSRRMDQSKHIAWAATRAKIFI